MIKLTKVFSIAGLIFFGILRSEKDPLEKFNRLVYGFNIVVDQSFSRPLAKAYLKIPEAFREPVSNFFQNVGFPVRFFSLLLSGKGEAAALEFKRFFFDSTVGVAGLLRPSQDLGLELLNYDLDLTLKDWGIDTGPYIMLPLLGPSSLRAIIPTVLSMSLNAWTSHLIDDPAIWVGLNSLNALTARAELEPLIENAERMSFDTYIFIRNFYLAKRSVGGILNEDNEDF